MSSFEEVHLLTPLAGGLGWLFQLKPLLGAVLGLPGMRGLLPLVKRAAVVASPLARLSFRSHPAVLDFHTREEVTVLNANLHHDWPRHRRLRQRLEAVARLIETENVDIALLQEVTRTPEFRADEWLAGRLGMAYLYSRANGHEHGIGFEEGLAILSRFPLSAPTLTDLRPTSPISRRLGLGARVSTDHGPLQVYSVHLGLLPKHNAGQLDHLLDWINKSAGNEPALIGGDFNTHENSSQIGLAQASWVDTFRQLHPAADGATHHLHLPWGQRWRRRRLDYLFMHPGNNKWDVVAASHVDAPGGPHSDHRAVLTRLRPVSS